MLDLTLEERRDYVVLALSAANMSSIDDETKYTLEECLQVIEDADSIEEAEDMIDYILGVVVRGALMGMSSMSSEDLGTLIDNTTSILEKTGITEK